MRKRNFKKRYCETCGEEFVPKASSSKNCPKHTRTKEEWARHHRLQTYIKQGLAVNNEDEPLANCGICGNEFVIALKSRRAQLRRVLESQPVYCSDDCRKEKRRRVAEVRRGGRVILKKKCVVCKEEFETHKENKTACSDTCIETKDKIVGEQGRDKKFGTIQTIEKKCMLEGCGKKFKTRPTRERVPIPPRARTWIKQQYCSTKCYKEWYTTTDEHIKQWMVSKSKESAKRAKRLGKPIPPILVKEQISQERLEIQKLLLEVKRAYKEKAGKRISHLITPSAKR